MTVPGPPGRGLEAAGGVVYVVERFPQRSQTFVQNEVRELHLLGVVPRVVALYPVREADPSAADLAADVLPSAAAHRSRLAAATARLALAHPVRLLRMLVVAGGCPRRLQAHALGKAIFLLDLLRRSPPPARLHAHFGRASASTAMLAAAALGIPFSFTAHASDVFVRPFDVGRKLRRARPAVTVCEYNRRWLEERWTAAVPIAIVPCGVQPDRFRRSTPYRRSPFTILAVGRHVEKKGFDDLVRACALLRDRGVAYRCRILGDGPERANLEALVARHALADAVALEPFATPDEVRAALEEASVFCLPCVVAADGDRDSQPVVIKEAMAMELPVVATAEVGNPEMVDQRTGRLVPPRAPEALADALAEIAALPEEALAEMGRAGRRRVEERFSLPQQAERLLACWGEDATPKA